MADPITSNPVSNIGGTPYVPATSPLGTTPTQYNAISTQAGNAQIQAANVQSQVNSGYTNISSSISSSLSKFNTKVNDLKGQLENNNIYKSVDQPKEFLKQQAKSFAKDQIQRYLVSSISKFTKTEFIARQLINKLTKQTKEQVKDKGQLTIVDGVFTFTPSKPGDYSVYKSNFDRKVANIKRSIERLKSILEIVKSVIKYLNIALSTLQIYIKAKLAKLAVKHAQVTADLASPSPSKSSGPSLLMINKDMLKLSKYDKKITKYQAIITIGQAFINILTTSLNDLLIELNKLQFIITGLPGNTPTDLDKQLQDAKTSAPDTSEYADNTGKSYILKLVTFPDGRKQYQALDSYSKLKITQTAPSKLKTAEQLLEEIKQILG